MINLDNCKKSKKGSDVKKALSNILNSFYIQKKFKNFKINYSLKYPETENYFKFDFLITFNDDITWIIHCTSTYRSDRAQGIEYRSEHLKKLNPSINSSYLIIPNGINEEEKKLGYDASKKIRTGKRFSSLDDVLTFRELELLIESKISSLDSVGKRNADRGISLEQRLARIFNNENNKKCWNHNSDNSIVGDNYDWFYMLLKSFGINESEKVLHIEATNKLPKLPSRGTPKTDVYIEIETDIQKYDIKVSCKNSHSNSVSVHEYSADDFIKVLGIESPTMANSIREFQKHGGKKAFMENSLDLYIEFSENISKYNKKLIEWAFFGIGGEGNNKQIANYMFTYKPQVDSFSIYNSQEYIEVQSKIKKQFNTPFTWTYPSGNKGNRIQLKAQVL